MKILVSCEDFYPSMGGAESWLEEVLEELGKHHEVQIHYVGSPFPRVNGFKAVAKSPYFALKFPILRRTLIRQYLANIRRKRYLRDIIKKEKPDLILTQLIYTPSTVDIAKEFGIPVIVFLHTYEHFCPCYYKEFHPSDPIHKTKRCYKMTTRLQEPFVSMLRVWHARALKQASAIVANSDYMKSVLRTVHGLDADVVFPLIDDEKYKVEKKSPEYVTFINPIKAKGVEVFIETAKLLPDVRFLVVGGVFGDFIGDVQSLPNVTYEPFQQDMRRVYAKSQIVIVPSQWYEPFGRMALESCIAGVPPIVSDRGGLAEAAGKGAVVIKDVANPNAWAHAILEMKKPKFYLERIKAARAHAQKYTKEKQMAKINAIIAQVMRRQR